MHERKFLLMSNFEIRINLRIHSIFSFLNQVIFSPTGQQFLVDKFDSHAHYIEEKTRNVKLYKSINITTGSPKIFPIKYRKKKNLRSKKTKHSIVIATCQTFTFLYKALWKY